jgi:holo-ACP synthase
LTSEALFAQLQAKERRHRRVQDLFSQFDRPVLVFKLNIPGPDKGDPKYRPLFEAGEELLMRQFDGRVLFHRTHHLATGSEAFYIIDGSGRSVKEEALRLEERSEITRLYDFDVYAPHLLHRGDLGFEERTCFICDRPAFECARSRRHPLPELTGHIDRLMHTLSTT